MADQPRWTQATGLYRTKDRTIGHYIMEGGKTIALVLDKTATPLLLAAPKLLDALKLTLATLELHMPALDDETLQEVSMLARAAIKEAEGGTL